MAILLWIQAVCCGGETASLLNSDHPHLQAALNTLGATMVGHSFFHDQSLGKAEQVMNDCADGKMHVDLLVVEGAAYLTVPQSATWASGSRSRLHRRCPAKSLLPRPLVAVPATQPTAIQSIAGRRNARRIWNGTMIERAFCRHPIETQPENGVPDCQFPMQRTRRSAREQAMARKVSAV